MTKREAKIQALRFASNVLCNLSLSGVETFDDYPEADARKITKAIIELSDQLFDRWKKLTENSDLNKTSPTPNE
jgi:hypothetical protein